MENFDRRAQQRTDPSQTAGQPVTDPRHPDPWDGNGGFEGNGEYGGNGGYGVNRADGGNSANGVSGGDTATFGAVPAQGPTYPGGSVHPTGSGYPADSASTGGSAYPAGAVPPPPGAPPAAPPYAAFSAEPGPAPEDGAVVGDGKPRRRMRRPAALLTAVAVGAAVIGGGTAFGMEELLGGAGGTSASAPTADGDTAAAEGTVSDVVKSVKDSVVEIKADSGSGQSTGSGVIITKGGEIVTNNHVVSGADTVKVSLSDGSTARADVVGTDADKDLALIKVEGQDDLHPASLGDSGAVGVGDQVVAIGSPQGLSNTVTSGIVSAKERKVKVPKGDGGQGTDPGQGQGQGQGQGGGLGDEWPFEYDGGQYNGGVQGDTTTYKALQTDASLNPGNSGGPLFNMAGQVVGINSAILSSGSGQGQTSQSDAGSVGLGFAIPVDDVKHDLGTLRDGGGA